MEKSTRQFSVKAYFFAPFNLILQVHYTKSPGSNGWLSTPYNVFCSINILKKAHRGKRAISNKRLSLAGYPAQQSGSICR